MNVKHLNDNTIFSDKSFTKRVVFSTKDELCFVLNFKSGQSLPVHKHENSSLILTALSGAGEVKVNNDIAKITKGSVLMAKGDDEFSIPNVTEDMSVLVTISPNPTNEMYSKDFG